MPHSACEAWMHVIFVYKQHRLKLRRLNIKPCRRAGVLPLVCKAFRRVLSGPSARLWPAITFDADISHPHQLERASSFLAWLRLHGQHSHSLQLELWSGGEAPQLAAEVQLLGEQLQDSLAGGGRAAGPCICSVFTRGRVPAKGCACTACLLGTSQWRVCACWGLLALAAW